MDDACLDSSACSAGEPPAVVLLDLLLAPRFLKCGIDGDVAVFRVGDTKAGVDNCESDPRLDASFTADESPIDDGESPKFRSPIHVSLPGRCNDDRPSLRKSTVDDASLQLRYTGATK